MNCAPKEDLALHVENDLPGAESAAIAQHLRACPECEQFCDGLRQSQLWFKSLRQELPAASAFAAVRGGVLSRIGDPEVVGWAVKLERLLLTGFRKPRYAVAGLLIAAVVLGTGEFRENSPVPVFQGDHLVRPDYSDWVFVGNSTGPAAVYISPAAYREYTQTGEFPEGTLLVREIGEASVEASVKDSRRFEAGWGYFAFTDRAEAVPESTGCRSCHAQKAQTDHVFTQFYPVLRSVGAIMAP